MTKYNMGCGMNLLDGYINVDQFKATGAQLVWHLENFPWPIEDNSADEILFNHSLEHMGRDPDVFCKIMQEIYRIAKPRAVLQINVPHPRHDHFIGDPTHVRMITPMMLQLFSKKNCAEWKRVGAANTPMAEYYNVDFEIQNVDQNIEKNFIQQFLLQVPEKEREAILNTASAIYNNVISEYKITLEVIKPADIHVIK